LPLMGCLKLTYEPVLKVITRTEQNTLSREGKSDAGLYKYKYNGKEWQDELGLNITAMDYRQYDVALGRFNSIDKLASLKYDSSPYRFGFNNPNFWIDPSGLFETRKEARKYRKKHGISGSISREKDGTFSIYDNKNSVSYSKGDDSNFNNDKHPDDGVVEAILLIGTKKTNDNNFVSNGKTVIDYGGLFATGLEAAPGTFRLGTTARAFSPKFYSSGWTGNQFTTTYGLSKFAKGLGTFGAVVGTGLDATGVYNYYSPIYGPNSPNSVHPAKASLNLGINVYGIYINPVPAVLYSGIDMFYPGGWTGDDKNPGLAKDQDRLNQENKAINPEWQLWPGAMKQ
jgi:RHS repeat-associated protein